MAHVTSTIDIHLEAYCEPDSERRNELLSRVWSESGTLIDPPFDGTGIGPISSMGEAVLEHYPGHRFRRTSDVDTHHVFARYAWDLVAPDGTVAVNGLDVVEFGEDGKLIRVVGFFGDLPGQVAS
ncbi:MAG TPA: nuclear transport factor 2 family protein [Acidimicrobiia bacterium]|nr:nuclear transport factor 2 family protein [Acidimicrobiia bacterium]